jgi:hypothetical protein
VALLLKALGVGYVKFDGMYQGDLIGIKRCYQGKGNSWRRSLLLVYQKYYDFVLLANMMPGQ